MEARIQADNSLKICEIDPKSLSSFMHGLLKNAKENMLRKDGFILPHAAFLPDFETRMVCFPLALTTRRNVTEDTFEDVLEDIKRRLPKLLEEQNAVCAAVVHEATYRQIPMFSSATSTPAHDDPNVEEIIMVEAADINDHWILMQPYYHGKNGTIVFDEPQLITNIRMTLQSDLFLNEVNFKGKKTDKRVRALIEAAKTGKVGKVKRLLSDGVNVNAYAQDSMTALMAASGEGHPRIVKLLLRKGAEVNAKTRDGWTPLMFASGQGHVEIVSVLIDHGADVNARWHYPRDLRSTALGMASAVKSDRHLKIMNLLLDGGARISAGIEIGFTALSVASWNGNLEGVKLLLDRGAIHGDQIRALHMAAGKDHLHIIDFFVDRGVDVNAKTEGGATALMRAAFHRNLAAVKHLIEKGANVNAVTSKGDTALSIALKEGHADVADLLASAAKAGAKVG